MSEKISIPIGLDASGISNDIQKASNNVGKATAGMARGISAAVGQSLGPFGELIEKADAFKQSLSGITTGSKMLAGAVGLAGVAAVYSVKKAIDAYKEMREEIDKTAQSLAALQTQSKSIPESILKSGVQPGQEGRALGLLDSARKDAMFSGMSDDQRASFAKAREYIESGQAGIDWEAKSFERNASPSLRKGLEEERLTEKYGGQTVEELARLRDTAYFDRERGVRMGGAAGVAVANDAQSLIDEIEPYLEAIKKSNEEGTKLLKEQSDAEAKQTEEDVKFLTYTKSDSPSKQVPTGYTMPSGYGVGGYTSTGGGGNIYGNTAGMSAKIQSMADNVKKIAENTTPRSEDSEPFITR